MFLFSLGMCPWITYQNWFIALHHTPSAPSHRFLSSPDNHGLIHPFGFLLLQVLLPSTLWSGSLIQISPSFKLEFRVHHLPETNPLYFIASNCRICFADPEYISFLWNFALNALKSGWSIQFFQHSWSLVLNSINLSWLTNWLQSSGRKMVTSGWHCWSAVKVSAKLDRQSNFVFLLTL